MIKLTHKVHDELKTGNAIIFQGSNLPLWSRFISNPFVIFSRYREYFVIAAVVSCFLRFTIACGVLIFNVFVILSVAFIKLGQSSFQLIYKYPLFLELAQIDSFEALKSYFVLDPVRYYLYPLIYLAVLLITFLFRNFMKRRSLDITCFLFRSRLISDFLTELELWYMDIYETKEQRTRRWYKRIRPFFAYAAVFLLPFIVGVYFQIPFFTFACLQPYTVYFFVWHLFAPDKSHQPAHIEYIERVIIPAWAPHLKTVYEFKDYVCSLPNGVVGPSIHDDPPRLELVDEDQTLKTNVVYLSRFTFNFTCVFYSALLRDSEMLSYYKQKDQRYPFLHRSSTNPFFPMRVVNVVGGGELPIPETVIDSRSGVSGAQADAVPPKGRAPVPGEHTDRAVARVINRLWTVIENSSPRAKLLGAVVGTVCIGAACYLVHEAVHAPVAAAEVKAEAKVKAVEINADKEIKLAEIDKEIKLSDNEVAKARAKAEEAKYKYKHAAKKAEWAEAQKNMKEARKGWW